MKKCQLILIAICLSILSYGQQENYIVGGPYDYTNGGSPEYYETVGNLVPTADSGYVLAYQAGCFSNTCTDALITMSNHFEVMKLDKNKKFEWTKIVRTNPGNHNANIRYMKVAQLHNGTYITSTASLYVDSVSGNTTTNTQLVCLDNAGNILWTKMLERSPIVSPGPGWNQAKDFVARDILVTANGFIIKGYADMPSGVRTAIRVVDFACSCGPDVPFLIEMDNSGNIIHNHGYHWNSGSANNYEGENLGNEAGSIFSNLSVLNNDGSILMITNGEDSSYFRPGSNRLAKDIDLIAINSNYTVGAARKMGDGIRAINPTFLTTTSDAIYIGLKARNATTNYNSVGVIKTDLNFNIQWSKEIYEGGASISAAISNISVEGNQIYVSYNYNELAILDLNGNLEAAYQYPSNSSAQENARNRYHIQPDGSCLVSGYGYMGGFYHTMDFFYLNNTSIDTLPSQNCHSFVPDRDKSVIDMNVSDRTFGSAVAPNTIDSVPAKIVQYYPITITDLPYADSMVCRNSVGITETNINAINIYPNPTTGKVQISTSGGRYDLKIANVLGEVIYTAMLSQASSLIDISAYKAGIYLFKITDKSDSKTILSKIIKQ